MRKARQDELPALAALMFDQFYEKEELRRGRALRGIPKRLLAQLTRNSRPVMAVHSMNWYRRYCNRPYYIAQFAVAKAHRGTGVARELMDGALARAAALGCQTVALETFSRENVPIYLHFGFQLKQVHTCGAFTEYRLLKPLE